MIRHFELALLDLFDRGQVTGTTHTCLGQEHLPVALKPLLDDKDYVFSNHRGHGHYLARFADPHGLLAEIMGRSGAVCQGVGGSQHILRERFLTTGVQGQSVPIAVGVALHLKRREPGRLAVVHIGDGTWGEGAVYEGLNMAALWQLPLLMIVENNGIAQSTPTSANLAGTIAGRVHGFGIDYESIDGTDVTAIRNLLTEPIARVRKQSRPLVVECRTERLGPHSKGDDSRDPRKLDLLRERDWYVTYRHALPDRFNAADLRQKDLVQRCVRDVEARPLAPHLEGEK
ncbi:dehydrogenase [Actinoplanes sp. ATCC 53533]|nr:dehydrogenase [Actinoplanes sp. ATCC 53533]